MTAKDPDQHDLRLIEAWLDGDEEAATKLYSQYVRQVLYLIEKNTSGQFGPKFDAEDVAQSVFRSLFRGVKEDRFELREDAWGLIRQIVLWKVRKRARFYRARKRSVNMEVAATEILPAFTQPTESEAMQIEETLQRLIEVLRPPEQKTLDLMMSGVSDTEIAAELNVTTRSVERYKRNIQASLSGFVDETDE